MKKDSIDWVLSQAERRPRRVGVLIGLMLMSTCVASGVSSAAPDAASAFERLKSLAGTWQVEGENETLTYSLTGNDSALIERFRSMSSVYHMDGNDLRVTHYCGAGNQPRMKAVSYRPEEGFLKFDFVDVSNVSAPDAYYTREIEIRFLGEDRLQIRFNGLEKGEEQPVTIRLSRK
ncbi:MAG TPA: hypothetical protein VEK15_24775 [Vicinamibacteria bacterium]|nr:hypothetical protein [Vicinamibacteria bacterium]